MKKLVLILPLILLSPELPAATPVEVKGFAIAKEADRRDTGFKDSTSNLTMILKNRHGQTSTRQIRNRILEITSDGDKSISIFDEPADVKGTAMLTFSHKTGNDDQWLYLPALKRVKRIASANKSGAFMGSEFAFEDISSQEIEKYTYEYIKDEKCDDQFCFVIERRPRYKYSGYTRQLVWVDKKYYRAMKIEYYDRKNELLKTQTFSNYRQYLGKFWRAGEIFMQNHQSGKSTRLLWTNFKFRTGLTNRDFDRNSLKRAR